MKRLGFSVAFLVLAATTWLFSFGIADIASDSAASLAVLVPGCFLLGVMDLAFFAGAICCLACAINPRLFSFD